MMLAKINSATAIDASAITLSGLCLIHCLVLPLAVAFLPIAGVVAEAEWVHKMFVVTAMPISAWAIVRSDQMSGRAVFVLLASVGLSLLVAAAFIEPLQNLETPLTVLGALMLASAHILRWRFHRKACVHDTTQS
jgi:hypothetical protein